MPTASALPPTGGAYLPPEALAAALSAGDVRALARALTLVDNALPGHEALLRALRPNPTVSVGITGPPGAGKSTLVNALCGMLLDAGKRIAVLAVDPSSPFHLGALLGDRIRLAGHFLNPNLYIRSFASRGSLGGLSESLLLAMDVVRSAPFDLILVETVGVGQSEVEIAGLADVTTLVLVPEGGDEVQGIKSGIMEIADVIAVNKADRPDAAGFAATLERLVHERSLPPYPKVLSTVATTGKGVEALWHAIEAVHAESMAAGPSPRRAYLLRERALTLLARQALAHLERQALLDELRVKSALPGFNLYRWVETKVPR